MKITAVSSISDQQTVVLLVGNTGNVLKASCLKTAFPFLLVGNCVYNLIFNQQYKKMTVHFKNVSIPAAES